MIDGVRDGREAAAWAVAGQLFALVGGSYRLGRGNPGGSMTNVLWFFPRSPGGPDIWLNPDGKAFIDGSPVWEGDVWTPIARGVTSAAATAAELRDRLPEDCRRPADPGSELDAVRLLALLARHSALFSLGWHISWGLFTDPAPWPRSDGRDPQVAWESFDAFEEPVVALSGGEGLDGSAGRYFFLQTADATEPGQPVVQIDLDGYAVGDGLSIDWTQPPLQGAPAESARQVIKSLKSSGPGSGGRPALGLAAVLAQFNRKERFWLLTEAAGVEPTEIHGSSLPLGEPMRARLKQATGWPVPAHSWAAMDFHLSWIAGAIEWASGATAPDSLEDLPQASPLVTGTQEDVDLIVAWATPDSYRVLLIEAKGVTSWGNKQALSKLARLDAIVKLAEERGLPVEWRYVLASPRRSAGLDVSGWPSWALDPEGQASWIPLRIPPARVKTQRCTESGAASDMGTHWRVITER